jgi:hypothetical protein
LLQIRADSFFNQRAANGGPLANDTFRLRRGEIRITAPAITDRISGTVMFDVARGLFANQSSTAAAASFGSNVLQELQLNYLLKKATLPANNTYIDIGQFKIPLGYEGDLVSSSALETIERGLIFTARDPFGGGYGDIRDTGIQLRGTINNQFDYRLGVFNGLGERQNQLATSDNKALVARLAYRPTGVPGLTVGVSGAKGSTRTTTSLVAPRADRDAFNVFGAYKKDKVVLQAEYLTGESLGFSVFPGTAINRKLSGYYGLFGYYFTPQLEGVARYDYLDTNRGGAGDTDVRDLTLGLNYYLKGNNAKIQANIVRREGGNNVLITNAGNPQSDLRNDRTELRIQTQIAF